MARYQTLTFEDGSALTASTSTVSFMENQYTLTEQELSANRTVRVDIGDGIEPVGVQRVRSAVKLLGEVFTQNEVRLVPTSSRQTDDKFHTFKYETQGLFERVNEESRHMRGADFEVIELRISPSPEQALRIDPTAKGGAGGVRYDIDLR